MPKLARGSQGNRFATLHSTGETLPCVFTKCLDTSAFKASGVSDYHDTYRYDLTDKRDSEYIEAIKRGRVLLARYTGSHEAGWKRKPEPYVAVYAAEDVKFSPENGLTFKARRLPS